MLLLLLLPLTAAQVCISDYDCAPNLRCVYSIDGRQRCSSDVGNGVEPDRYPIVECFIDSDCAGGQVCVLANNGDRLCHSRSQGLACNTDKDCGPGAVCNPQGQGKRCQIATGGNFGKPAGVGGSCRRDADCEDNLSCVDRNGVLSCLIVTGGTVTQQACSSSRDCPEKQECIYRPLSNTLECMWIGESVQSGGVVTPSPTTQLLCASSRDCPDKQECIYRASIKKFECMWKGDSVQTGGVVTPSPIAGGFVGSVASFDQNSVQTGGLITPSPVAGGYVNNVASADQNYFQTGGVVTPRPIAGGFVGRAPMTYDKGLSPKETSAQFEDIQLSQDEKAQMFENNVTLIPTYEVVRAPATVPRQALIDPAALPCEYDYQCRMGEACTGLLQMVDRNVTVCQYDVTKPNRTCIYHSDCLHGQRCEQVPDNELFICRASLEAALGNFPCVFDYECSGGEKCVNISNSTTKQFRCRTPQFADPRRNQRCFTNADCAFQQVCRHVAEVSMCVDVGVMVSNVASQDIQKKIVDFVQNLLFARL